MQIDVNESRLSRLIIREKDVRKLWLAHPYKNAKFYKRLREHFLEHVESLETVSRAEIATAFGRRLYTEDVC